MMFETCAIAPSGSPPGRPSLRCRPAFSWSVSTSKPTLTRATPSSEDTDLTTAVWKWFLIGQPGVVSDTVTSTTPASLMSIARTISSSTMLRRSSGSMTALRASVTCSRVGTLPLWQLPLAPPDAEEVRAVVVPGDADLEHRADAAGVELVLERLGLERVEVLREQQALEVPVRHFGLLAAAHHLRAVERVARVVLLAVAAPDSRMREHHDARLGAVAARLPRTRLGHGLAVVVLGRVLAHVPDVALAVLRVVVERVLDQSAVLGRPVVDHAHDDAGGDPLRPVRDGHDDALRHSARRRLAVDPARAGLHRPERVVDVRAEAGRGGHGECADECGEHGRDRTRAG